jgi:hypothetical protein
VSIISGQAHLLPSLTSKIAPADAMLSNFMYKRLDVSLRGKGLENRILANLAKNGIPGKNVNSHHKGEEYECDIVFILEENLFFVECKAFLQPDSPRTYYEFVDKITNAPNQLIRISSFYENNIEIIRDKFGMPETWMPKQIYKIIVSGALLGESFSINDCYVTDESILQRFFDREAPGIAIEHAKIAIPNENYADSITVQKLMNVISSPPPIELTKARMNKRSMSLELHNLIFSYHDLDGVELSVMGRKKLKKLAKSLGISANYLRKKINGQ